MSNGHGSFAHVYIHCLYKPKGGINMLETYRTVDAVSKELIDGYIRASYDLTGWKLAEGTSQRCSRPLHALFHAITEFLAKVKQTKGPGVALTLDDQFGNFQFAGIVKYHPSEDPDQPGNWSYSFTFNPPDIEGLKVYSSNSVEFKTVFSDIADHIYGITMDPMSGDDESTRKMVYSSLAEIGIVTIKNWIDENSVSTDPVATEIKGKCIIDALIDGEGNKIGAITPSGEMKNIIKDDARLEEAKETESK